MLAAGSALSSVIYLRHALCDNVCTGRQGPGGRAGPGHQGDAYWLLDEIAQRFEKTVAGEEFQVWEADGQSRPQRVSRLRERQRRTVFEKAMGWTPFATVEPARYNCESIVIEGGIPCP